MHRALKRFLNLPIKIEPYQGMSGTGESKYGTPRTEKGFLEGTMTLVRNKQGEEVTSQYSLYLDTDGGGLGMKDRITLPDGSTPRIINIQINYDRHGKLDHIEVYL